MNPDAVQRQGAPQEGDPAASREPSPPGSRDDAARTAGRGGLAVLAAKVFFLLAGFVQQPLLRRAVGLNDFGALAQALVVANAVNNVAITSGTQGVSRVVTSAAGHEDEALRATLRVHLVLAVVIGALVAFAAPLYASFEHAQDVVAPLLVLAGVALLYCIYAPFIGYLNGRNRFSRQAALDMAFAVFRTVGLAGVAYAFVRYGLSGVLGATVGWLSAAALIVPLAAQSTGLGKALARGGPRPPGVPTTRAYLMLLAPIAGAQICVNLLLQIDIVMLGRFLGDSALGAGLAADAQRDVVTQWLAIYKECQTFAFLPYQLPFSVTLILFPMLSRVRAENDLVAVRAYVARGTRLAAIFCGLIVGAIVAMPQSMIAFAYNTADAAKGADVLRIMTLAQGAFSMLGIATTTLTSLGRERTSAMLNLAATIAVAAACAAFVPHADFGHTQLVRCAQASGAALGATLVVAGFIVHRRTGAFLSFGTALRVGLAVAGCMGLGFFMPPLGRLLTPLAALAVGVAYVAILVVTGEIGRAGVAYVAILVVTGEIGRADLGMVRAMASRKRR